MKKKTTLMDGQMRDTGEDWRMSLPDDWTIMVRDENGEETTIALREHPTLAKYASKDDAVKALVHAQKLIGRKPEGFITPLGPDADNEERTAFFAALGRPDNADGYELPELELPDGFELDEDLRTMFRTKAHELGLSADQVRGLYEWFLPINIEAFRELLDGDEQQRNQEMETLRNVHRGEMPKVVDAARQVALALGGEELLQALNETGAGNRAPVINAFARMAPSLLEGRLKSRSAGPVQTLTEEKLTEMMHDPRYHDPMQRDSAFVRQITDGFDRLYPGTYKPGNRI